MNVLDLMLELEMDYLLVLELDNLLELVLVEELVLYFCIFNNSCYYII